jgi:hypothetical protein
MDVNNLEKEPIQESKPDAASQTQMNVSADENPMTPASAPQPEEEPKKKKKFFIWFLFALGAFALVQSIIVFSKTDNPEIVDNEPKIEVEETFLNEQPADEEEEEFTGGIGGSYPTIPPAPTPPVDTDEIDEEEEVDFVELTIEDCIEADLVMAGIDPEDIDDEVIQQCLILWEDLQNLLDEEEEDEEETATSTVPAIRRGHGGGGGGGNEVVLPSEDASLGLFDVEFINALPFYGLQVTDFAELGATLFVDDYFCSDIEFTSEPCLNKNKPLVGLFFQANSEHISYMKVEIERPSPLLIWPAPVEIWENEEILELEIEDILVGDVIRVTVIAEDTITENLYKLSIVENVENDASLAEYTIGKYDILSLDNLRVKDIAHPGAILEISDDIFEGCDPWDSQICPNMIDLYGLFLDANDPDASYRSVSLYRDNHWTIWENKGVNLLESKQFYLDDVIVVKIISEDGLVEALYKVTIQLEDDCPNTNPAELTNCSKPTTKPTTDNKPVDTAPLVVKTSGGSPAAIVETIKEIAVEEVVKEETKVEVIKIEAEPILDQEIKEPAVIIEPIIEALEIMTDTVEIIKENIKNPVE